MVEQEQVGPSASASPSATASPTIVNGSTKLKVKTDSDVWISVWVDGKTVFSGTMNVGQEKDFSGKTISITAGKGDKVQVQENDGAWKVLADVPGVVRSISFGESLK